ncbi:hypothetical protein J2P12_06505, partial [Candidatus Bathyarchaeota archaeon]|nr:hypothetical protein [Candidatus Bathyarchaeota archaeon]
MPTQEFPGLKKLTAGLSAVFHTRGLAHVRIRVIDRIPNREESSFPTEIVTCVLDQKGTTVRLFVKYGTRAFDNVHRHRGDISYEAKVYREVLQPLGISTPTFYGVYRDKTTKAPWLVIEFLEGSRGHWSQNHEAMIVSARWIGKFHALNEERLSRPGLKFLHRYDSKYYLGWARRANRLLSNSQSRVPWLSTLCDRFAILLPNLLERPAMTVIHGEYYSNNTLYQNGICSPVDWQSAAVAAGEIDLAALTQSRPSQMVQQCEREYSRARWPDGPPEAFQQILETARVYMNLRWLGDPSLMSRLFSPRGEFTPSEKFKKMIKGIYSAGK